MINQGVCGAVMHGMLWFGNFVIDHLSSSLGMFRKQNLYWSSINKERVKLTPEKKDFHQWY
jgi:hypothetical protein